MGNARSLFRDFENHLRIVVGLDEDCIRLILKQYNEKFITFELSTSIYRIKDIAKAVYTKGDHEGTLQFEFDDISLKTKLVLTRSVTTIGTLKLDEHSFFNSLLGFTTYLDYKPTNAIHAVSSGVYTSDSFLKISTVKKSFKM